MQIKKLTLLLIVLASILVGWLSLGGTAAVMKATSSTEFCVSCHTMEIAYEEYQGSVHFSNAKGIRAECSDCHIPQEPMDYLWTKIKASKDIYHQFVSKKIDTEDQYEDHRMAMAEMVWETFRANDSATCRSCHTHEAMDPWEQSEDAAKMHEYGQENNQTCIDCHKGVAHFAPEPELDAEAFNQLVSKTEATAANASVVYPIDMIAMGDFGTISPATTLEVISQENGQRTVKIKGSQMTGAESVIYMAQGQRAIIAVLTEAGQAELVLGEPETDRYGNEWRDAELTATIDAKVLDTLDPLWTYAEELDNVYCATCHAKIGAEHYTVNAWGPVAKGMGDRTDISTLDLEILTKYFQHHARDVAGH